MRPRSLRLIAPEAAAPLPMVTGPNGAVGIALDERFMVNSVVRKNADGSLSMECVTGNEQAAKAVAQAQESKAPAGKEDDHEK